MERSILAELLQWKEATNRKPLIVQGARQVGKTWIMTYFGQTYFKNVVYINFEQNTRLQQIFKDDFNIQRILSIFEIESGKTIIPANTLLILDEIQEADKGLTALKYFFENAPEYYVMAAGSLLGVSLQTHHTFPVGKVAFLTLYPLSFAEFLINLNESSLVKAIQNKQWAVIEPFHDKLIAYLRTYYFVGGMPEVVNAYINNKNLSEVRTLQTQILRGYELDFAKYAPIEAVPKIRLVWDSILGQLAKENKKFIYGQLRKGARAKEFEVAINWLLHAGLLTKCMRINQVSIPLSSYADYDVFKLFFLDIGLLNAKANISEQLLLNQHQVMVEFKGALTEQFVCQELRLNHDVYYWTSERARAEIDFLIQSGTHIIPIEVKAEENLKAKSLYVFEEKYTTQAATRLSMSRYREQDWMLNIPLYATMTLASL